MCNPAAKSESIYQDQTNQLLKIGTPAPIIDLEHRRGSAKLFKEMLTCQDQSGGIELLHL